VLNRVAEAKGDIVSLIHHASTVQVNSNDNSHARHQNPHPQVAQAAALLAQALDVDSGEAEEAEEFSHKWSQYWTSFHRYFITGAISRSSAVMSIS
jgi:hypothetical protein